MTGSSAKKEKTGHIGRLLIRWFEIRHFGV
jgi:hypothetical protein